MNPGVQWPDSDQYHDAPTTVSRRQRRGTSCGEPPSAESVAQHQSSAQTCTGHEAELHRNCQPGRVVAGPVPHSAIIPGAATVALNHGVIPRIVAVGKPSQLKPGASLNRLTGSSSAPSMARPTSCPHGNLSDPSAKDNQHSIRQRKHLVEVRRVEHYSDTIGSRFEQLLQTKAAARISRPRVGFSITIAKVAGLKLTSEDELLLIPARKAPAAGATLGARTSNRSRISRVIRAASCQWIVPRRAPAPFSAWFSVMTYPIPGHRDVGHRARTRSPVGHAASRKRSASDARRLSEQFAVCRTFDGCNTDNLPAADIEAGLVDANGPTCVRDRHARARYDGRPRDRTASSQLAGDRLAARALP